MKLIMSIVNNDDVRQLVQALLTAGYQATLVSTTGGFLREGNTTILSAVEDDQVDSVLNIIQANCHTRTQEVLPLPPIAEMGEVYWPTPIEVEVGGATVFVFNIRRFEKF